MKKLSLTLAVILLATLCFGALVSHASVSRDYVFYNTGDCFENPTNLGRHKANGYLPVTVVGNAEGGSADNGFDAEGKLKYNSNTNWSVRAIPQTTANGTWWGAPAATYTNPVKANEFVVPVIGGAGGWGAPYEGDMSEHRLWYTNDYTGAWTEITDFTVSKKTHDGTYVDANWGYVCIFVYTLDTPVEASCFLLTTGSDNVQLQMNHFYAAYDPEADTGSGIVTADPTVTSPIETEPPFVTEIPDGESRYLFTQKQYNHVAINLKVKADGSYTSSSSNWNWTSAYPDSGIAQFTYDGNFKYFPYVGYKEAVTANELVIGNVTGWSATAAQFQDYDDLQVYWSNDPANDGWTLISSNNSWYNCDVELNGTYTHGGIKFVFDDAISAKYFLLYDPDPTKNELWLSCGTFTAVYDVANEGANVTTAPETDPVTTVAPETDPVTTVAPETDPVTTVAPETDPVTTDAPATDAPATDAPATDAPATDAPATDAPATDAPAPDTGDFALASIAIVALAAAGVVLCAKKKQN
ncbi:MAG: hypothetical protein IJD10_03345 [Clostridia bacterium]|nr:hypothetical protein [Clostridia bacterium]